MADAITDESLETCLRVVHRALRAVDVPEEAVGERLQGTLEPDRLRRSIFYPVNTVVWGIAVR